MIQKKFKKLCGIIMASICVGMTTIPVHAVTTSFNITVGKTSNPDPLSKKMIKSDKEQNFYATLTGTSSKQSLVKAYSMEYSESKVRSNDVFLYGFGVGTKQSTNYLSYAAPNKYYYMHARWSSGPSTINITGRYTP